MAQSRKQAWLRDELILALDLYRREGRNPPREAIRELSDRLRAIPIESELAEDPRFRNPTAVQLKLYNFTSIDPDAETVGMTRGGQRDRSVWDEFADDPHRLAAASEAIRQYIGALSSDEPQEDEDDFPDAPEGRILTRVHRVRERNSRLVAQKKGNAMAASGRLACEVCRFDFARVYGEHGEGFIECHHTVPLHSLKPGTRTKLGDLALVCSNCHRMIHRRSTWLTVEDLRAMVSVSSPSS